MTFEFATTFGWLVEEEIQSQGTGYAHSFMIESELSKKSNSGWILRDVTPIVKGGDTVALRYAWQRPISDGNEE